jgi:hypothetical protein
MTNTTDLDNAIAAINGALLEIGPAMAAATDHGLPTDHPVHIKLEIIEGSLGSALPGLIALRDGAGVVKPLDLSNLLRAAFLSGRGLKDGQKMTADDQRAWADWADGDLYEYAAFQRINAALGTKPFPASHGEG